MATFDISSVNHPSIDRITVKGVIVGAFAVHHTTLISGDDWEYDRTWTVTHRAAGHALARFKTRAHALLLAGLLDHAVWSDPRWEFGCNVASLKRRKFYKEAQAHAKKALSGFRPEDFA